MKRQRPPTLELDDDDEADEFRPLFDYSETMAPAPTFLSDDSDEDDVIITSGPPQLRPKLSPAKVPPTLTPRKEEAPNVILDDDDDDSWLMPSPAKLPNLPSPAKFPSTLPSPASRLTGNHTVQQLRLKRMELMMLQQKSSPEALRRVEEQAVRRVEEQAVRRVEEQALRRAEEQARIQAQNRQEAEPPLVVETPNSLNFHGESPRSEAAASHGKEKILIKVQNKAGNVQPIRIYMSDKFEKLFRVYADVAKVPLVNLSFRFDGDQLSPNSTPKEHDMEDGELIEVYSNS